MRDNLLALVVGFFGAILALALVTLGALALLWGILAACEGSILTGLFIGLVGSTIAGTGISLGVRLLAPL